jgi:hypothetical protein
MNNQTLQVILTIVGAIGSVGILAGGFGFLFSKFRKGTMEEKTDIMSSADQLTNFWKEQITGFKDVIKELREKLEIQTKEFNTQLQVMGNELGQVRGQLEAEARQKKEYLAILENRDPATKQFMEYMVKSMENQDKMLQEIFKYAKLEHDRDFKVEAIVTKT